MPTVNLRDRDAVLTREGLIFRVYGYAHPPKAYICDVEYAPAAVFKSEDPRALRQKGKQVWYKFYTDQGLRFVQEHYPQYTVWHAPLQTRLVSVHSKQILQIRKPDETLQKLLAAPLGDSLFQALQRLLDIVVTRTGLSRTDFGVFGSLLHGFYHPGFSDLDFVIYGGEELRRLRDNLQTMYKERSSHLHNEFETEEAVKEKVDHWRFMNYSPKEYGWHQQRKTVYGLFHDGKSRRVIKTEFEPVKKQSEIQNEYDARTRILKKGWIRAVASVTDDSEAAFMPSIYGVEIKKILGGAGAKADSIKRIISYVEEFRMQTERDEEVYLEGNLEQVITASKTFHQVTLTYGPRYYEQVLKVSKR